MSENKHYYYLKLKNDFFDGEEMKIIEAQKNGVEYQNLYLKLCLLSVKTEGQLIFKDLIPYDLSMLSIVLRIKIDTVKTGIEMFMKLGLVERLDNGTMYMMDIQALIGHGSSAAERKALYRKKIKELKDGTKGGTLSGHCPPELELENRVRDKDKAKSKSKDILPSGKGELIKLYNKLLKGKGILYKPAQYEYPAFYRKLAEYERDGATVEQAKTLMTIWFEKDIGQWCGFKLSSFWGDIGKLQLAMKPKKTKGQQAMEEFIRGE